MTYSAQQLLNDPLLNKGTAFTHEERDAFGLHGLLPYHVTSMQEQLERRYQNFKEKKTALEKHTYLSALQNRNEILFYRLVYEHVTEMLPFIYTPTVGDVSLLFSVLYRKNRGVYLSYPLKDKIDSILNTVTKEIDVIVVTDGERVLGLGDVGVGGMAISQGKLVLYTLFGGIHPARALPIMLDVGTNNENLLKDPLYLGWRHPRISGKEYDAFIDAFIAGVKRRFPYVLLQWEDFAKSHARPLLDRYRSSLCSFNDDIQGTAAVTLAAILSALKLSKKALKDQKIAILGGGSAGLGIAELLFQAMRLEGASEEEARRQFYIIDVDGLVHTALFHIPSELKPFAQPHDRVASWKKGDTITLLDVVRHAKPSILIGVCARSGMFTETIVKEMASYTERPIILPLSNPTSYSEAAPKDLLEWTQGRAIIATGSPFDPVMYEGRLYPIAQCNNVYIFPGLGLGACVSKAKEISDTMLIHAAKTLSSYSPLLKDPQALLFPSLDELRSISRAIALSLAPHTDSILDEKIWFPEYPNYA
jgi:malate dehydrogenase (oxaloacetate-decarboxylating)